MNGYERKGARRLAMPLRCLLGMMGLAAWTASADVAESWEQSSKRVLELAERQDFDGARRLAEQMLGAKEAETPGEDIPALMDVLEVLSHIYRTAGDDNRFDDVQERMRRELRRYLAGGQPRDVVFLQRWSSDASLFLKDDELAQALVEEFLQVAGRLYGKRSLVHAEASKQQGYLYGRRGDWTQAAHFYGEALAAAESTLAADDPELAAYLYQAASAKRQLPEQAPAAMALFQRVLAVHSEQPAPDDFLAIRRLVGSLDALIDYHHAEERYAEAEPLLHRLVVVAQHELAHTDAGLARRRLAENLLRQRKWPEAAVAYAELRTVLADGPDRHLVEATYRHAAAEIAAGRFAEAAVAWKEMVELRSARLGGSATETLDGWRLLAVLQRAIGQDAAAEDSLRHAAAVASPTPTDPASVGSTMELYLLSPPGTMMLSMLDERERTLTEAGKADPEASALVLELRAETLLLLGFSDLAVGEYRKALSLRTKTKGKDDPATQRCAARLAALSEQTGDRLDEAIRETRELLRRP